MIILSHGRVYRLPMFLQPSWREWDPPCCLPFCVNKVLISHQFFRGSNTDPDPSRTWSRARKRGCLVPTSKLLEGYFEVINSGLPSLLTSTEAAVEGSDIGPSAQQYQWDHEEMLGYSLVRQKGQHPISQLGLCWAALPSGSRACGVT